MPAISGKFSRKRRVCTSEQRVCGRKIGHIQQLQQSYFQSKMGQTGLDVQRKRCLLRCYCSSEHCDIQLAQLVNEQSCKEPDSLKQKKNFKNWNIHRKCMRNYFTFSQGHCVSLFVIIDLFTEPCVFGLSSCRKQVNHALKQ